MKRTTTLFALAALAAATVGAAADTTIVTFDNGTEGWLGPQGFGGTTFIDPNDGVGGGPGLRTQFNDFGITFRNNSNPAFIGNFAPYQQVTIGIDVKVQQIGTFLPVSRPFLVELRDFDSAQGGFPWTSVYFLFEWISQDTHSEYTHFEVTITDPSSTELPTGWGGFGDEDPNTFEPRLPPGVTFADVLAGVDEIAFTTLLPGYFFTFDDYDLTLDNISITTVVPAPGAAGVLAMGLIPVCRRRRR